MKKSLIAVAVLGAFAGVASAQSSVTLFGIVDLSVNSFENRNTRIRSMDSNQLNSDRLGFRGTEDLGGGLLAGFWLEGGIATDTGNAAGLSFTRRSTVSLTSKMGEIRLGRDYTNTFLNVAGNDAYGANGMGSPFNIYLGGSRKLANDLVLSDGTTLKKDTVVSSTGAALGSGATTAVRADNMVGYFLPSGLGGISGSVQVAAGEGVVGNKYYGGNLGYAAGPFSVSGAYSTTFALGGIKYKVANLAGSFDFGMAKLYAFYDKRGYNGLTYATYSINGSVPLGQGEFRAGYTRGDAKGGATNADDAQLFGVEYIYNLSKRTALYTQYGRLTNKGASALSLGGVVSAADAAAGGFKSQGYGVGVRHSF